MELANDTDKFRKHDWLVILSKFSCAICQPALSAKLKIYPMILCLSESMIN